jgi:hypothetical protein
LQLPKERPIPDPRRSATFATTGRFPRILPRAVLSRHGIAPIGRGRQRYRWIDISKIEREASLPAWQWPAHREPPRRPTDLPARDPRGRSDRTFRRLLASGAIPSILLSPGVRRVRASVFERVVGNV